MAPCRHWTESNLLATLTMRFVSLVVTSAISCAQNIALHPSFVWQGAHLVVACS